MDYKLSAVRIYVIDWEKSVEFYSTVLEMPVVFASAETGWAELDTGEAHLALERVNPDDPEAADLVGRFVSVSLQVNDIRARYETLKSRGVDFLAAPEKQPWGGVLAHFRDTEGNVLTLLGA